MILTLGLNLCSTFITVKSFINSIESKSEEIETYFAFRTVELVQDKLDDGNSFYFKINEKPIFMSGSNFIPNQPITGDKESNIPDLLKLAKKSGIKMLRVWGGGIYQVLGFSLLK